MNIKYVESDVTTYNEDCFLSLSTPAIKITFIEIADTKTKIDNCLDMMLVEIYENYVLKDSNKKKVLIIRKISKEILQLLKISNDATRGYIMQPLLEDRKLTCSGYMNYLMTEE